LHGKILIACELSSVCTLFFNRYIERSCHAVGMEGHDVCMTPGCLSRRDRQNNILPRDTGQRHVFFPALIFTGFPLGREVWKRSGIS
jgi:hypothetical protein